MPTGSTGRSCKKTIHSKKLELTEKQEIILTSISKRANIVKQCSLPLLIIPERDLCSHQRKIENCHFRGVQLINVSVSLKVQPLTLSDTFFDKTYGPLAGIPSTENYVALHFINPIKKFLFDIFFNTSMTLFMNA